MDTQALSQLCIGQRARIDQIEQPDLQLALMNLGILEGDECELSDIAPLGDPIAIRVNGTKVSLRRKDAAKVWVISANE